jgi:hypothetical protein
MISKDRLISLSEQVSTNTNSSIKTMKFSLMPGTEPVTTNMTSSRRHYFAKIPLTNAPYLFIIEFYNRKL